MPQVSAAVLRSTPSSTSASASIRRAAALFFSPLAALRSSQAVRSSRVIDTAAPIDAAPLKSQHRVRVSLIWESLMSHSFGPLVLAILFFAMLSNGERFGHVAKAQTIASVLAAQIRSQGFACDEPQKATRDAKLSKPDYDVWVLTCKNATYRIGRYPDMAAKVEKLK